MVTSQHTVEIAQRNSHRRRSTFSNDQQVYPITTQPLGSGHNVCEGIVSLAVGKEHEHTIGDTGPGQE